MELHDRIATVIASCRLPPDDMTSDEIADAVIAELGKRRCERCRKPHYLADFPPPHEGSVEMRPYCITCTNYIEWATS